jgi:ferrous iron transport protein A
MFLTNAEEKKSYKIVKIEEGKGIKLKLASMGLLPGKTVKIVKNDFRGPIIVAVKAGRISVGRGLSKKIQISSL